MRTAKGGEPAWKTLTVRVIPAEGHPRKRKVFRAPAGKLYVADGIDKLLDHVADYLEKRHPHWEFRLVELAPNVFNFVYVGLKEDPQAQYDARE